MVDGGTDESNVADRRRMTQGSTTQETGPPKHAPFLDDPGPDVKRAVGEPRPGTGDAGVVGPVARDVGWRHRPLSVVRQRPV